MAEHTQIISSTPRRTRIKISRKRRNQKEMARLAQGLSASESVSRVETNLKAGTLIVYHKEEALEKIKHQLENLGVILAAMEGQGSAKSLSDAVSDLDKYLGSATGGLLNLKLLAPIGLGVLAALQLARRGLEIGGAPWYLLAYFAFESYTRLNRPEETCAPAESTKEETAGGTA